VFNQMAVVCCGLVLVCPGLYALQGRALRGATNFAFRLLDRVSNRALGTFRKQRRTPSARCWPARKQTAKAAHLKASNELGEAGQ